MFLLDMVPEKPKVEVAPEPTLIDKLSQPEMIIAMAIIAVAVVVIIVLAKKK